MFEFFRKHTKTDFEEIQKFLFGDVSLSEWKTVDKKADMIEPWSSFDVITSYSIHYTKLYDV